MVWVAIVLLAVAALAPLGVALERRAASRGARGLSIELHRTQLAELDRDLAEGRVLPTEHATAVLEVQRRLLAAADMQEGGARMGSRVPILAVMTLVPAGALGLYLIGGQPEMPSVRAADTATQARAMEEASLIGTLRERLAAMDPNTDQARQGYVLLGNVEAARGDDAAAVKAWKTVLATQFDPTLAVRVVDASVRLDGGLTPASEGLLRRALAAAGQDVPWRKAVEERLAAVKR